LDAARNLLDRVGFVELAGPVLARALEAFPQPVRTLDALHLATADFLRGRASQLTLATYDERMRAAARALKIPLAEL
ncbi:MAG: PIN domain-containing protein, partial [Gemmatimonadota bacterium]|nr:PIN domain-containing protein [Gemmatimonadota bacterium]